MSHDVPSKLSIALINFTVFHSLGFWYPSCLHTTVASLESHKLLLTVPHIPLTHTSTLPSLLPVPPTRRILPLLKHWGDAVNIHTEKLVGAVYNKNNTLNAILIQPLNSGCPTTHVTNTFRHFQLYATIIDIFWKCITRLWISAVTHDTRSPFPTPAYS